MGAYRCRKDARFSRWFAAGLIPLALVSRGRAAFIANLNDVSVSSTFENATAGTTPAPVGWASVGSEGIRTFRGSGGGNAMMIAATGNVSNYTAQYDTGVAIQPLTAYTLTTEIGFSTTASQGSLPNGFSIEIGELSGGVFIPLATDNSSAFYLYNANSQTPYYSVSAQTQYTTGTAVDASHVAVELIRTSPDNTDWLGFDDVTLDATRVPETHLPAAMFAGAALAVQWRRRVVTTG